MHFIGKVLAAKVSDSPTNDQGRAHINFRIGIDFRDGLPSVAAQMR